MAFGGLGLIALGTGGIKPCVAAFGGDQFKEHQVTIQVLTAAVYIIVYRCICYLNSSQFSTSPLTLGALYQHY